MFTKCTLLTTWLLHDDHLHLCSWYLFFSNSLKRSKIVVCCVPSVFTNFLKLVWFAADFTSSPATLHLEIFENKNEQEKKTFEIPFARRGVDGAIITIKHVIFHSIPSTKKKLLKWRQSVAPFVEMRFSVSFRVCWLFRFSILAPSGPSLYALWCKGSWRRMLRFSNEFSVFLCSLNARLPPNWVVTKSLFWASQKNTKRPQ